MPDLHYISNAHNTPRVLHCCSKNSALFQCPHFHLYVARCPHFSPYVPTVDCAQTGRFKFSGCIYVTVIPLILFFFFYNIISPQSTLHLKRQPHTQDQLPTTTYSRSTANIHIIKTGYQQAPCNQPSISYWPSPAQPWQSPSRKAAQQTHQPLQP